MKPNINSLQLQLYQKQKCNIMAFNLKASPVAVIVGLNEKVRFTVN